MPPIIPEESNPFVYIVGSVDSTKVLAKVSCFQPGDILGIFGSSDDGVAALLTATVIPLNILPVNITAARAMKVCLDVWAALTSVGNVKVVAHVL